MEKNKTAEKYLTQTVTAKWDIIFGALVAVGVILFLVGWGWGYYFSIPAVFVGAAGFILARSQRVSDDDYQGLLDHILVDNRIEKTAKPGALMLTSYVMKDSRIARHRQGAAQRHIFYGGVWLRRRIVPHRNAHGRYRKSNGCREQIYRAGGGKAEDRG